METSLDLSEFIDPELRAREIFAKYIRFPTPIKPSEWAEKHRVVGSTSARSGQWDFAVTPYLREIHDAVLEPGVTDVVVMVSAQCGKTETLINLAGWLAHNDPSSILMVMPTEQMAREFSKSRLDQAIMLSPALQDIFPTVGKKTRDSTILTKGFKGGRISLTGSNSPVSASSRPIRCVLADEIDRWGLQTTNDEGSMVSLVAKRTASYPNAIRVWVSTPTTDMESEIYRKYKQGDQRHYFITCPDCGLEQTLKFKNLRYDKKDVTTARFHCEDTHCQARWGDSEKQELVAAGHWRPTEEPADPSVVSFHLWQGYSSFTRIRTIAAEWLEKKNDPFLLRTFVNTVLGEPYVIRQETSSLDELPREEIELDQLPNEIAWLVAAVDIQHDHAYYTISGLGYNPVYSQLPQQVRLHTWVLQTGVVKGKTQASPIDPEGLWCRLMTEFGEVDYTRNDGIEVPLVSIAIDSGYASQHVYGFVNYWEKRSQKWWEDRPTFRRSIYAIKGDGMTSLPLRRPSPKHVMKSGLIRPDLHSVGTNPIKDLLSREIMDENSSSLTLREAICTDDFIAQLQSEYRTVQSRGGKEFSRWIHDKRISPRNDYLDTLVYTHWLRMQLDRGIVQYIQRQNIANSQL